MPVLPCLPPRPCWGSAPDWERDSVFSCNFEPNLGDFLPHCTALFSEGDRELQGGRVTCPKSQIWEET